MMAEPKTVPLISKFRGCLIGSHVGDCLGERFEREGGPTIQKSVLKRCFTSVLDQKEIGGKQLRYTDDTAMTLSLGKSLVERKGFDAVDMSKRFAEGYSRDPYRCYGTHVVTVFHALSASHYSSVLEPARKQFGGSGSYGNGAAMRVAPVALFCYNKNIDMIELVKSTASITHTHQHGYNGAILQCLAIDQALRTKSEEPIDPVQFIDRLMSHMVKLEPMLPKAKGYEESVPYSSRLHLMKDYFEHGSHPSENTIIKSLGNDVAAQQSVPTAIYSFLRGLSPLKDFESDNPFIRALFFAISLGGDTDTIGAMTGAIAGAYHGEEMIPEVLQKRCEALGCSKSLADDLYNSTAEQK